MTSSLFSGITAGLTNTYSVLANASPSGITLQSISSAQSNATYAASINPTFASYITSNFALLDTNHDGVLSSAELSNLTTSIASTGLTSAQLSQLGPASGLSNDQLGQVLDHFADIDTNHDGKVTAAEITAYKLKSAEEIEKTKFANKAAADMSVFYGSDDSSASSADASSLLSYKYMNNGNNGSSGSSNGSSI